MVLLKVSNGEWRLLLLLKAIAHQRCDGHPCGEAQIILRVVGTLTYSKRDVRLVLKSLILPSNNIKAVILSRQRPRHLAVIIEGRGVRLGLGQDLLSLLD